MTRTQHVATAIAGLAVGLAFFVVALGFCISPWIILTIGVVVGLAARLLPD